MIITAIAYSSDKNLGAAYNSIMERVNDDDWVCFVDHDAMFTTTCWYRQLQEAVKHRSEKISLLTGVANRTGALWQRASGTDVNNHDIRYHRKIGAALADQHGAAVRDVTQNFPLGGYVMCISKSAWVDVGGFVDGMYCVDHRMHLAMKEAGLRIGLLPGLYLYHWRRAEGSEQIDPSICAPCPCINMENK